MKTEVIVCTLTLPVPAAANLVRRRFATVAGAVPAAGAWCPGVVNSDADTGDQVGVNTHGALLVEAGAAIGAGVAVETDASGRAVTLASGASLGRTLDAAGAAGEFIRILR